MSGMIEVKTADLIGPALDWAVSAVEGVKIKINLPYRAPAGNVFGVPSLECVGSTDDRGYALDWAPSTDWSQGGPLIDKYELLIEPPVRGVEGISGVEWSSRLYTDPNDHDQEFEYYEMSGPTALVAACRVIIDAKLGETVQVPAELVTQ